MILKKYILRNLKIVNRLIFLMSIRFFLFFFFENFCFRKKLILLFSKDALN